MASVPRQVRYLCVARRTDGAVVAYHTHVAGAVNYGHGVRGILSSPGWGRLQTDRITLNDGENTYHVLLDGEQRVYIAVVRAGQRRYGGTGCESLVGPCGACVAESPPFPCVFSIFHIVGTPVLLPPLAGHSTGGSASVDSTPGLHGRAGLASAGAVSSFP